MANNFLARHFTPLCGGMQFVPRIREEEKRLTQFLADTLWRLERIPVLEADIYAIGRRQLQ